MPTPQLKVTSGGDPNLPEEWGLVSAVADTSGTRNFSHKPNVISRPLRASVRWNDTMLAEGASPVGGITVRRLADGGVNVSMRLAASKAAVGGRVEALWSLALAPGVPAFVFEAAGAARGGVLAVYAEVEFQAVSATGLYDDGVVQAMRRMWASFLPSRERLRGVYFVGPKGAGAIEVYPAQAAGHAGRVLMMSTDDAAGLRHLLLGLPAGLFATVVGTLATHRGAAVEGAQLKQLTTGLLHPSRGYARTFNFFDPDGYFATAALMLAGSPFIGEQVRLVIERSGSMLCGEDGRGGASHNISCLPRQLPHHFVDDIPVYHAPPGARQTGPNVFWTLAALNYAQWSGNGTWLATYLPTLRLALSFLKVDQGTDLVWAPGSLMVDTFYRVGYTSDTNAAMLHLLREFALAEEAVGDAWRAAALRDQARAIQKAMNKLLWDGVANDHYVTSVSREGEVSDFVDYDSNFMAIAFGAAGTRAAAIIERIDSNPYARNVPTWVSERLYEGNYSRPKGGTGDSVCGMARFAWFNSLARKRMRTASSRAFFMDRLLGKLSDELITTVWMKERFGPDGRQQSDRTSHYFEYPSVVALMIVKILYGIKIDLSAVFVDPWDLKRFRWRMGDVDVFYRRAQGASIKIPRVGKVSYKLTGMATGAGREFVIKVDCEGAFGAARQPGSETSAFTDAKGDLEFLAVLPECTTSTRGPWTADEAWGVGKSKEGFGYATVLVSRKAPSLL